MNPQVTTRVFLLGSFVGILLTLISVVRKVLEVITFSLYSGSLEDWLFMLVWGVICGGLMVGCYSIYISEGKWGLIRLVLILGFFVGVFLFIAFGNLGIKMF